MKKSNLIQFISGEFHVGWDGLPYRAWPSYDFEICLDDWSRSPKYLLCFYCKGLLLKKLDESCVIQIKIIIFCSNRKHYFCSYSLVMPPIRRLLMLSRFSVEMDSIVNTLSKSWCVTPKFSKFTKVLLRFKNSSSAANTCKHTFNS